jgi:hypothetical protein
MTTYTITIVSAERLNELNYAEFAKAAISYGGKTYTGFRLLENGSCVGAYQGIAEGEEVIFYGIEVAEAKKESND